MADGTGQADIRGIDINKMAKGFADEALVLKRYVANASSKAREMRWYKKTAGFLDSPDSTAITASQIANTSDGSRPVVVGQTWTRVTSYARKYFVESPMVSEEDIKDNDVDVLSTHVRDLTLAVMNQIDSRIYDVLTESLSPSDINTTAAVGTGWDDTTNGDPVGDLLTAKKKIRQNRYDPEGAILYINSVEHDNLVKYLIRKGTLHNELTGEKVESGVVGRIVGLKVVVSENATTDYALVFVPQRAATWKSFKGLQSGIVTEVGVGRKIRIWEEGECLLTDPKAVHLTTDTVT